MQSSEHAAQHRWDVVQHSSTWTQPCRGCWPHLAAAAAPAGGRRPARRTAMRPPLHACRLPGSLAPQRRRGTGGAGRQRPAGMACTPVPPSAAGQEEVSDEEVASRVHAGQECVQRAMCHMQQLVKPVHHIAGKNPLHKLAVYRHRVDAPGSLNYSWLQSSTSGHLARPRRDIGVHSMGLPTAH